MWRGATRGRRCGRCHLGNRKKWNTMFLLVICLTQSTHSHPGVQNMLCFKIYRICTILVRDISCGVSCRKPLHFVVLCFLLCFYFLFRCRHKVNWLDFKKSSWFELLQNSKPASWKEVSWVWHPTHVRGTLVSYLSRANLITVASCVQTLHSSHYD